MLSKPELSTCPMGHLSLYKDFTFTFKSIIATITLYQLKTNVNARLTNKAASDALPRGRSEMNPLWVPRCEHFGFPIQVAFLKVRKCDLRLLFLLNHTNILFLST